MSKKIIFDKGFNDFTKYIDERTGYLHVKGVVARDGIQEYLGIELGDEDNPMEVFNVLRPTEEVLHVDSLKTYINAPVTDNHPDVFVEVAKDKKTRDLIKGVSISCDTKLEDGVNFVECELIIKDEALVEKIQNGKVEISAGYTQEMVKEDGELDGVSYHYKQTDIRINHIAIVDKGRCGDACKVSLDKKVIITDENQIKRNKMPTVTIDGVSHEVTDCIAKHISSLNAKVKSLDEDIEKKDEELEKTQAEKDVLEEEVEKAKDLNASEIVAEISERVKMLAELLSAGVEAEATDSVADMKRKYIANKSKVSLDGKSDAYVDAAYDMLRVEAVKDSQAKVIDGFKSKDGEATADSAYEAYKKTLQDAYKGAK